MKELETKYEITRRDVRKDKLLRAGAWSSPFVISLVPAGILIALAFLFGSTAPTIAPLLFFGLIWLVVGFVFGLVVSGGLMLYRSRWLTRVRERLAVDGIKAEEIDWFRHELTAAERKSLAEIEGKNLLLADAFRDSLAARLTATRILKSAKQELQLAERQKNKLKYSKTDNASSYQADLTKDIEKLTGIRREAEAMQLEAEKRMRTIESAARHGTNFSETEMTLKKLSARVNELPLALEAAKMEEEIRQELEREDPPREDGNKAIES